MYSTTAFALALCNSDVFEDGSEPSHQGLVKETYRVGWGLVGAGVTYLSCWNIVLGIPGEIGMTGYAFIFLGAILVTGNGLSGACVARSDCGSDSERRCDSSTWWNVWLLRLYFTVVYFYAGAAKLESDWLQGWTLQEILRWWTGNCLICNV